MLASRNRALQPGDHYLELRHASLIPRLFLDLEDAESVRCWVDDPGGPGEADVGDAVFCLEPRGVVVFDLDAAGAEFGQLGTDVADLPRCLGLLVGGPGGALGHVQVGAATALN